MPRAPKPYPGSRLLIGPRPRAYWAMVRRYSSSDCGGSWAPPSPAPTRRSWPLPGGVGMVGLKPDAGVDPMPHCTVEPTGKPPPWPMGKSQPGKPWLPISNWYA